MSKMIYRFRTPLLVGFVLLLLFGRNILIHRFSSEGWKKYPEKRVDMVDDLLSKNELIGMTQEEVITLLGQSTDTEYFKTENNMVYYLGPERGLISIDSEWLVLEMQENQITKVSILCD